MRALIGILIALVVLAIVGIPNVVMRRRGYAIPGRTPARCSRGHLFLTTWIEGGSLKAVRLGPTLRYQFCPVCRRLRLVRPVKESDLSEAERRQISPEA